MAANGKTNFQWKKEKKEPGFLFQRSKLEPPVTREKVKHLTPQPQCILRVVWNITFILEEEAFQPDGTDGGDDGGSDDLPGFQAFALDIDLPPALLKVDQHHLLVHLQGTLDMSTATQK